MNCKTRLLFVWLLAGCGRSALDPVTDPASLGLVMAAPDAGALSAPESCRAIGVYAPVGNFAEHAAPDYTDAEYTSGSAWTGDSGGSHDTMWASVTWARAGVETGATVPGSFDLAREGTFTHCTHCVIFCELDTAIDRCRRRYLAREGTGTVTEASRGVTGTFKASLRDLVFRQWDLLSDTAVPHGACITVASAVFNGRF